MLVLTVKQPWAWLIFNGKDVENRTWYTKVRGKVGIHSSAKLDTSAYTELVTAGHALPKEEDLVYGAILGTVDIIDCTRTYKSIWKDPGSFGFILSDQQEFDTPIKCKGKLNFWSYDIPENDIKYKVERNETI